MRPNLEELKSRSTSIGAIVLLMGPVPVTRHSMEMLYVLQRHVSHEIPHQGSKHEATYSLVALLMFTAINSRLDLFIKYCTVPSIPPAREPDSTLNVPRPCMFRRNWPLNS